MLKPYLVVDGRHGVRIKSFWTYYGAQRWIARNSLKEFLFTEYVPYW